MLGITVNPDLLRELAERQEKGHIGVIFLDTVDYESLEQSKGRAFCDTVNAAVGELLHPAMQETGEVVTIQKAGDDWYLFVQLDEREARFARHRLGQLAAELKRRLEYGFELLNHEIPIRVHAGWSLLDGNRKITARTIYTAFKAAVRSIHMPPAVDDNDARWREFRCILQDRSITSVYQPIVSLTDAAVFGYEALTRGPASSSFHSPLELFGYAEKNGGLYTLDRLAREKAIAGCEGLGSDQRVFINIPAHVIHDPQFAPGHTLKLLEQRGISPRNVVLEITERCSIEDFSTVKKILAHYRSQGYQIAIDDAGAGYSSLQAIAELQPDYIKVDRSLIRNIHQDKMKESILETFVTFARKMSIRIIAEGIESWEELRKLSGMGVHFAQGFLIGRPIAKLMPLPADIRDELQRINRIQSYDSLLPIGSLGVKIRTFGYKEPISEVANYFKRHADMTGTVIVQGDLPVGLVMRDRLFQQLAGQYGVSLYWNRPIEQLMDRDPLIVEESVPVELVSRSAMAREKNRLYDLVVITSQERMAGVASIQTILEAITNLRMETARVANPLTGLPGNTQINREMNKRLVDGQPFSVIYADLDYFKWFNDRYGFQRGDQLIQYTADVLQQSVFACGRPDDFVGHVGGDDFIVITSAPEAERVCEEIIRRFQVGVVLFYEAEEWSYVEDRDGNRKDSDGVHISLSLVICRCVGSVTQDQISRTAASLKKEAKARSGSVFAAAYLDGCCAPAGASNSDNSCSIL